MKGSECHSLSGPVGTTSVWPAKHTTGWPLPLRAQRFVTSPKGIGSQRKPACSRRRARSAWQPPSCGVTEQRAISSWANARALSPSGIRVDLEIVERSGRPLLAERSLGGRGGGLRRQGLAADLPGGRLIDEPEHVGRGVGVRHGFVLGDLALHEQLEERLLEGLGAWRHAFLKRVLDLAELDLLDQLGDVPCVAQYLHCGNA